MPQVTLSWRWIFYITLTATAAFWWTNVLIGVLFAVDAQVGNFALIVLAPLCWGLMAFRSVRVESGAPIYLAAWFIAIVYVVIILSTELVFYGLLRDNLEPLFTLPSLLGYIWLAVMPFAGAWYYDKNHNRYNYVTQKDINIWFILVLLGIVVLFMMHFLLLP